MDSLDALALPVAPAPATLSQHGPTQLPDGADFEREGARVLPEGLRLQDYEIVGTIGEGGLGVVYLAWDHAQERHVAIKEYLPAVLAGRASTSTAVAVTSPRHQDSFRIGLRAFVHEARILARFDHPALVRVLHHWEENGTAYMAMPYYQGPTLARALAELGRPPEEGELRGWLRPLLDALGTMHTLSCFHRDVSPDNILLTETGPVLLDFGAARRVIDSAGQSSAVVSKPGYTPIEQYGELASMRQGPWTDLYALAAVVYGAITGQPPISSIERMPDDPLQPLCRLAHGRYGERFLAVIDAALAVLPQDRPQSAAEFAGRMGEDAVPCGSASDTVPSASRGPTTRPPAVEAAQAVALHAAVRGFGPAVSAPTRRSELVAAMALRPRSQRAPAPARRSRFGFPVLAGTAALLVGVAMAAHHRIGDPTRTQAPLLAALPATTADLATPTPASTESWPLRAVAVPPAPLDAPESAPVAEAPLPPPHPASQPSAASAAAAAPALAAAAAPARAYPSFATVSRPPVQPVRPVRRESRARAVEPPATVMAEAAPARTGRCSELLLRASLEPLGAGEAAVLKKGCE